jgi:hypothetical protein
MTAIAIIALIVSVVALSVSSWDAWSDRRSATAAEDSAVSARQSADSSRQSAEAAARTVQLEADRIHEELRPLVTNGHFVFVEPPKDGELRFLTYIFWLNRPYSMTAVVSRSDQGQPTSPRDVSGPYDDGGYRIRVGEWPRGSERPWHELTIHFWPPAGEPGRADPWTCACGRETKWREGPGHWDFPVRVSAPPRPTFP